MTFTKLEQVNDYIENILMIESFKLDEGHKISISGKKEQVLYFIERNNDKNDKTQIYHLFWQK